MSLLVGLSKAIELSCPILYTANIYVEHLLSLTVRMFPKLIIEKSNNGLEPHIHIEKAHNTATLNHYSYSIHCNTVLYSVHTILFFAQLS